MCSLRESIELEALFKTLKNTALLSKIPAKLVKILSYGKRMEVETGMCNILQTIKVGSILFQLRWRSFETLDILSC